MRLQISFSVNMVSGGGLALGHEICLGMLVFIADDSAWLQEAPLNIEALPVREVTHFRASACGVLLRQPSNKYRLAPVVSSLPPSAVASDLVIRCSSGG